MGGPFDMGGPSGKGGKLPRHIERMNAGTKAPEMKKSDGNLPWGGTPSEKSKVYATGKPSSKGSMKSKLGNRGSAKGGSSKAMQGFSGQIKTKKGT